MTSLRKSIVLLCIVTLFFYSANLFRRHIFPRTTYYTDPSFVPTRFSHNRLTDFDSSVLLKEYNYQPCSWMAKPLNIRYPRIRPHSVSGKPAAPSSQTSHLYKCFSNLVAARERGELQFTLFGGTGIAATTAGGNTQATLADESETEDLDIRLTVLNSRTKHMVVREHCSNMSLGIPETFFSSVLPDGVASFRFFF